MQNLLKYQIKNIINDFVKEMHIDVKAPSNKNDRHRPFKRLFKAPAIMSSRIFTIILSENPKEQCERLKFIIQEKQAGKNSVKNNEKNCCYSR